MKKCLSIAYFIFPLTYYFSIQCQYTSLFDELSLNYDDMENNQDQLNLESLESLLAKFEEPDFSNENMEDNFNMESNLKSDVKDAYLKQIQEKFPMKLMKVEKFSCQICAKLLDTNILSVTNHMISDHNLEEVYTCNECHVAIGTRYEHKMHMNIHYRVENDPNVKKYFCHKCKNIQMISIDDLETAETEKNKKEDVKPLSIIQQKKVMSLPTDILQGDVVKNIRNYMKQINLFKRKYNLENSELGTEKTTKEQDPIVKEFLENKNRKLNTKIEND